MTPTSHPHSRREAIPELDDPIALPFPEDTLLLDDWSWAGERSPAPPAALALRALQQQQGELGLHLPFQLLDPEGAGDTAEGRMLGPTQADGQHLLLEMEGFRVQLVCAPFWSDGFPLPTAPWGQVHGSPHLVVAAWVDGAAGAIRFAGVLTAAEVLAVVPGLAHGHGVQHLELESLRGGLDRLFTLVRLLPPEAVARPEPAKRRVATRGAGAEAGQEGVPILQWLEGHLGAALAPFAPEWVPVNAAAFRSGLAAPGTAVLVAVAIPLALVAGRVRWGAQQTTGSERFRLLLSICGRAGRAERLDVRLEPKLPGDLLPENLALVVGEQVEETGAHGNQGPLVLSAAAGEQLIEISLERQGMTEMQLPPILLLPHLPKS